MSNGLLAKLIKRFLLVGLFVLLSSHAGLASVAFDATASSSTGNGSTSLSFNITIGAGSNRCIGIGLSFGDQATPTGITVTVDGVSAVSVSGTAETNFTTHTEIFALAAPHSGTVAVAINWTNATSLIAGAIAVTGCDQSTPMNNGTFNSVTSTSNALAITSTSGALTMSVLTLSSGHVPTATDQTEKWKTQAPGVVVGGGGDIGPGTGTTTHTWTFGNSVSTVSGANFKASTGGGATCTGALMLLGAGGC